LFDSRAWIGCRASAAGGPSRPHRWVRVRLDAWLKLLPGRSVAARREKALVTMATLVGALIIARAVDDPALSDEVLEATATELRRR